jgi:cadmium resistance protein CadD (predicted permease)
MQSLQILGMGLVAFVSTSIDNLGVLVAFFAARELDPRSVWAGYLAIAVGVAGAAWAASKLALLLPAQDLGYVGVVPLLLGVRSAWQLRRPEPRPIVALPKAVGVLAVALVTLAQSVDNLIVYVSLFADSASRLKPTLFGALVGSAALWCALGFWLGRRSLLAEPLRRAMRFALPVLLMAVGAYILRDTLTDVVPG